MQIYKLKVGNNNTHGLGSLIGIKFQYDVWKQSLVIIQSIENNYYRVCPYKASMFPSGKSFWSVSDAQLMLIQNNSNINIF